MMRAFEQDHRTRIRRLQRVANQQPEDRPPTMSLTQLQKLRTAGVTPTDFG